MQDAYRHEPQEIAKAVHMIPSRAPSGSGLLQALLRLVVHGAVAVPKATIVRHGIAGNK